MLTSYQTRSIIVNVKMQVLNAGILHFRESPRHGNGHGASASVPVPTFAAHGLGERWTAALEPLDSRAEGENGRGMITDDVATAGRPTATPARKPTFLQKERWKAIQKARRKGMSLRAIERELGIHRATIKKYMDAEGPPMRTIPGGCCHAVI